MSHPADAQNILDFWFKETSPEQWYKKDDAFDASLRQKFGDMVERGLAKKLDNWADTSDGCLALIILLDQITRNIFRDTPKAFAGDAHALALSKKAHKKGWIKDAAQESHRQFFLMPMMHAEDLAVQDASLPLFKSLVSEMTHEHAIKHRDIIAQFGHFPHRNAILGRASSKTEIAFLKQPGSSF